MVQLPHFGSKKRAIECKCGEAMTVLLTENNEVYSFGKTSFNRLGHQKKGVHKVLDDITHFSIGCRHAFCWNRNTGKVYGWGFNMYNQLCTGFEKDIKTPEIIQPLSNVKINSIESGYFHAVAMINE